MAETVQEVRPPEPPPKPPEVPRQTEPRAEQGRDDQARESQSTAREEAGAALRAEHGNAMRDDGGRSIADGQDSLRPTPEFQAGLDQTKAAQDERAVRAEGATFDPPARQETASERQDPGGGEKTEHGAGAQAEARETAGQAAAREHGAATGQQGDGVHEGRDTTKGDTRAVPNETDATLGEAAPSLKHTPEDAPSSKVEASPGSEVTESRAMSGAEGVDDANGRATTAEASGGEVTDGVPATSPEPTAGVDGDLASGKTAGRADDTGAKGSTAGGETDQLSGAGGSWETLDERPGGAVGQVNPYSCTSACGEMLSGRPQEEIIDKIGSPAFQGALAKELGPEWSAVAVGPGDLHSAKVLCDTGPWAADLWNANAKMHHTVVVDGIDDENRLSVRDPWDGGSTYKMAWESFDGVWSGVAVVKLPSEDQR
jgi:hypothetical protein